MKFMAGLVREASSKSNPASFNNTIKVCKQEHSRQALQIFHTLEDVIDSSTYISLLQACSKHKALPEGKLIHAHINVSTNLRVLMTDPIIHNSLITMYVKCDELESARRVFDEMQRRNSCSWSVMIAAYAKHGFLVQEALLLFRQMQENYVKCNEFTYSSVLPACAKLGSLKLGMEVHKQVIERGFQSDLVVANALVDMYAKCGSVEDARQVFDKMPEPNVVSWTAMIAGYSKLGNLKEALILFQKMPYKDQFARTAMIAAYAENGMVDAAWKLFDEMSERNVVSWNAMIAGFVQNSRSEEAIKLFKQMQLLGVRSDSKTFASILPLCAELGALDQGMEIHDKIVRGGYQFEVILVNMLIDMYAKCGRIEKARELLDNMRQPDVISWTSLITGYAQNGRGDEALKLFQKMQSVGIKPDSNTFSSVLSVCANVAALQQGMGIHRELIRNGFQCYLPVMNALIDMYAKCGIMYKASKVFDNMQKRNVVSWTTMIAGYALHGCGSEALKLFEEMKGSGINPDHVTLVCVLSACNHAGLVEEGYKYFNCMSYQYNITPTMEHYSCMVDLLGRAGHLDKAQDVINKMPLRPNISILCCLLAACKIHNNVELGEHVAEHILELDPINPAPYVILSNIYATVGRWVDLEKIRKMMNDRGIKKTPGLSWIEVNKQVHSFVVGDESQPQMEIYGKLDTLASDENVDGYILDGFIAKSY
ncbi:pentatricopeptide repeat-containing protein At3g16610 [Cryptomeria japonica]|uniref:pentatricopeptide repeat-containing protein At3g16610 n=1 Tax=Cryptomeria japonica TaxID=3369 RepID=UPI0027DA2921|nr:pentatricopeptide repeat-containing protein At3g16610 [Cryptomeria japonica]XP_057858386.2 pentatricopeptide repeat-containing protein At3g16610 [Cryptomeria japonica]